jgi:hypothetical protein
MLFSTRTNAGFTTDSLALSTDSISSQNAIEEKVVSSAVDSIAYDLHSKKVFLYHEAKVLYGDVTLEAAYIELDADKNMVYATGQRDSSGQMYGYPVFTEGGKSFSSKEMRYNFKTKKGLIKEVVTQEGEGYIHGAKVKKQANDVIHTHRGQYTTCDAAEPHFSIHAKKIKTIPGEKIITGPAQLRIAGVPTPLVLPFGFFPSQQKQSSGLIIPIYGESANLGFFLRNGGYYFAINDYLDLALKADIYTKGSWGMKAISSYKKRYKYSGNLNLSYARMKSGHEDLGNLSDKRDFFIRWKHQQDPKARPNSRFSADVNAGSSSYHQNNSYSDRDYLSNTFQSNISYSKNWRKANFTSSLSHSQNTLNRSVRLSLPEASFQLNRLYPFKSLNNSGQSKWYDKIGLSYNVNARNEISTIDSLLFEEESLHNFKNGLKHHIPVSTSIKALKHFTLSPRFNYTERWYFDRIEKYWDGQEIQKDTLEGFSRLYDYSFSTSLNTKLYGMFVFKKGKVKAIRHLLSPSLSFNYKPDFSDERFGFYQSVQSDSLGNTQLYSIAEEGIYGSPSKGNSGNVRLQIGNSLEMKVASMQDSLETVKKIKLIESFNLSTAYNIFADSLNLSVINLNARTRLFNTFDINFSANFDPYVINASGNRIHQLYLAESGRLARFTKAQSSINFHLNQSGKKENQQPWMDYIDFDIPWNLSVRYSATYSRPIAEKSIDHSLNFSGDLKLTDKWKIGFNSGYDFEAKDLSYTSLDIYRDLHCWEMRFKWIPFGNHQSYNFTIRVKASTLQDLKWEKKKDWYDY